MRFKLRIPGRDDIQAAPVAKVANLRIVDIPALQVCRPTQSANDAPNSAPAREPIRRFAGFAAPEVCETDHEAMRERRANGTPHRLADPLARLQPWTDEEIRAFQRRQARISWLGYGDDAEHLAETLLRRDRDMDERRLCVECSHTGPGWRCDKKAGFLLEQLQRCDNFMESTQ